MDKFDAARLEACRVKNPETQQVTVIKELVDRVEFNEETDDGHVVQMILKMEESTTTRKAGGLDFRT